MSEYLDPCTACAPLRHRLDALQATSDNHHVSLRLEGDDGEIDGQAPGINPRRLTVVCSKCAGHGATLTAEGAMLAAVIGRHLKGSVIL